MQRKVVDPRVVELVQRCAVNRARGLLLICGEAAVERVADVYGLWVSKTMVPKATMLWCYDENIALSGYRQKQLSRLKHNRKLGISKDISEDDTPQTLMQRHATIKFMYYKDTARALGQTYDILVLQDASKVTPSILCHTIETVQGGGLVMFVDRKNKLQNGDMFIARMLSYIRGCKNALIVNDVLDVISPCRFNDITQEASQEVMHNNNNKNNNNNNNNIGNGNGNNEDNEEISSKSGDENNTDDGSSYCPSKVMKLCLTKDQENALEECYKNLFVQKSSSASANPIPNIISIVSPRGRGKSALLGLLIAAICVHRRQNILGQGQGQGSGNNMVNLMHNFTSNFERILVIAPMADEGSNSGPMVTINPHCIKALENMDMVKGINYSINFSQNIMRGKKKTISGTTLSSTSGKMFGNDSSNEIFSMRLKTVCPGSSHVISYLDSKRVVKIYNSGESMLTSMLSSFDLIIVDEAATIPIPVIKAITGLKSTNDSGLYSSVEELNWGLQRHVILSSTVHGYEGTGRSLAVKLFSEFEKLYSSNKDGGDASRYLSIKLQQPIRYSENCPVEEFLNKLLLLDSDKKIENKNNKNTGTSTTLPALSNTAFFVLSPYVFLPYFRGLLPGDEENTLEQILTSAYSLFTTSHYRNTPDDIRRMMVGDGGTRLSRHGMGVLIEKKDPSAPDASVVNILSAVHFAFEGGASYGTNGNMGNDGSIAASDINVQGHLSPSVLENYYQEKRQASGSSAFSSIMGLRVIRIATRSDAQRMGYGKALMKGLEDFFSVSESEINITQESKYSNILDITQNVINWALEINNPAHTTAPSLPPVLISKKDFIKDPSIVPAVSRCMEMNNNNNLFLPKYISVSYGLTTELLKFYGRLGYCIVFIRTAANSATGEHSCIVVKDIVSPEQPDKGEEDKEDKEGKETTKTTKTSKSPSTKQKKKKTTVKKAPSISEILKALFTNWANDFSWRLLRESRGVLRTLNPDLVLRMIRANDEYCRKNFKYYENNIEREQKLFGTSEIIGPHRTPIFSARDMLRISAVAGVSSGRCTISYSSLDTENEGNDSGAVGIDTDMYVGVSGWRLISDLLPVLVDYYFSESPCCFSTTTKPNMKLGLLGIKNDLNGVSKSDESKLLVLSPATIIILLGAMMKGGLEWVSRSSLNFSPAQASQYLQRGIETMYNYITAKQLDEAEAKDIKAPSAKRSPK